jgi:hypothetical protein
MGIAMNAQKPHSPPTMRLPALLAVGFLLSLASCEKSPPTVEESPPRRAPDGILYVLEEISLTSDTGIFKLAPGREVQIVAVNGNTVRVRYKDREIEAPRESFTDSVDIREELLAIRSANQAELARKVREGKEREYQQIQETVQSSQLHHAQTSAQRIAKAEAELRSLDARINLARRELQEKRGWSNPRAHSSGYGIRRNKVLGTLSEDAARLDELESKQRALREYIRHAKAANR